MPRRRSSFPPPRRHKARDLAVVTVRLADGSRKDIYLGSWPPDQRNPPPEVVAEYNRVIAEVAAAGGALPCPGGTSDITIVELVSRYRTHAERHYQKPDGTLTSTVDGIREAMRTLRVMYGTLPGREFGPLKLKAVRERLISDGLSRSTVNKRIMIIKAAFKWFASEELIPAAVAVALTTVKGLERGRSGAKESEPVRPPDPEHIDKALPFLPPPVAALVRLQLLCGARPGELVGLKAADIDRAETPWVVRLGDHKTAHRGKARVLYFGPAARELLAPVILRAGDGYLFSPARWEADRIAARAAERATPRYPSHMKRNAAKRKRYRRRPPGEHYTVGSYREAIARACDKAGVPTWSPHQLRHAAATHLRKEFGVELARVILGHSTAFTTEIYAEFDQAKAVAAVEKAG
jgi:integrase